MIADLLVLKPLPSIEAELAADFTLHRPEKLDSAALARLGPLVRGIVTPGGGQVDKALIDALPKLELIACFGVGTDQVDSVHAASRGILVTNTPDVLTDEVADLALGLLLATVRRIAAGDRHVRAGKWPSGGFPLVDSLIGKKVGIIGLGRIGSAIARRAEAFGLQIAYHNRNQRSDTAYRYYADLRSLARDSDILMIVTPGGPETRHLVDAAVLEALGPKGYLINIGRGSNVDEAALIAALAGGRLAGAGLDVFEKEPHVPEALRAMENVVLQPHMGSATPNTRKAMADLVIANVRAHFAGRPVLTPLA